MIIYWNRNFNRRLDEMERKLRGECQLDIERCAMIARLRCYLREVSFYRRENKFFLT